MDLLTTIAMEAGSTARNAQDRLADVITGGQSATVEIVGSVTDVPGELARPAADAAASPFDALKWIAGFVAVVAVADLAINGGRGLRKLGIG